VLHFPGLLRMIAAHLEERRQYQVSSSIRWIRFLTSHPKDLSHELVDVIADNPLFCRHIHLPFQSGSDAVLAEMNRRYTREGYLSLVEELKEKIPQLTLSTDIMVGFPGETEEDFEQTLDLMRRCPFFICVHVPLQCERRHPGGSNAEPDPRQGEERAAFTRHCASKEITVSLMRERVGQVDEVLIEGLSRRSSNEVLARTTRDEMVVFAASRKRVGQFARVRLLSITGNTFRGEEVEV